MTPIPAAAPEGGGAVAASRARDALQHVRTVARTGHSDPAADLARVGALVRLLRAERGMPQAVLARRAVLARSTVQRLERGVLRPRRSTLYWVAWGLDPDHAVMIRDALTEAAGGRDALAEEGRWAGRRARRANRLLPAGRVPLPSDLQRRIRLHQQAAAARARAFAILDRPGALDSCAHLEAASALLAEDMRLRGEAGGLIAVGTGGRRVVYGL